jgi:hypothetical protein
VRASSTGRHVRRLILAAAIAAGTLVPASPAVAKPGLEIAVQDDFALVTTAYGVSGRDKALDRAGQFRTKWVRANVLWAAVNGKQARSRSKPKKVRYDWAAYDQLINATKARGMNLQLTLTTPAPAWATGNKKIGPYKPNATHFRAFVKAAVQHFAPHVQRYSILNEPNHTGWLAPLKSAPGLYRSMYAGAYSEIKKYDKGAEVLIGETSPHKTSRSLAPVDFLNKVLSGTKLRADGYAHHPYDLGHAPNFAYPGKSNATLGTLGNLVGELDRQHAAGRLRTPSGGALDLFLTEYGYLRQGRYKLSEDKRAQYLEQAYNMAIDHPRVRQILQYLLMEPSKKYAFFDMSLMNRKGTPFGAAFQRLVDWTNTHQGRLNGQTGGGGGSGGGGGTAPPPGGGGGGCTPTITNPCLPTG